MPPSSNRSSQNLSSTISNVKPSLAFVAMIFGALIAFEIFNYSTTDHALSDLLGDLTFAGLPWSTLLALAFCGIDFAGIARLFTPEQGADEPKEVWYLFGAWLLAATMNAILTWWGVSLAVANRVIESSSIVDPQTITSVVPVFVAVMVWVIRILLIGTLSLAMDRLLHPGAEPYSVLQKQQGLLQHRVSAPAARPQQLPAQQARPMNIPASLNSAAIPQRPAMSRTAQPANPRPSRFSAAAEEQEFPAEAPVRSSRPEPTYHSLSMNARPASTAHGSAKDSSSANPYRRS